MSRGAVYAVAVGACVTAGLVVAVVVSPGGTGRTAEIYLFVVGAISVAGLLVAIADALPRDEPSLPERTPRPQRLVQLESIQRLLDRAERSSFELHHGLRPIVREIAAARLARHGVGLDRQPARARALLGAQTWELVRADREAPVRGSGRGGCSRDELGAIVDGLEAI